jgi:hypothetical protein
MGFRKTWVFGAALWGALLCGANSQAGSISFIATGSFTPSSTATYTNGPASVTYTSLGLSSATTPANVSLGTFTTASSPPSSPSTAVSSTFTLTVENIATFDMITFTGTMSGSISPSSSSASVVFSTPLSETLDGFIFTIVNADQNMPGRINLNAPTTNGGVSTIDAIVTSAVPEPSSVVLLGLAVPALAGLAYRRARR